MILLTKYQKAWKIKLYVLLCFVFLASFAHAQKGIVNNGAKMIISNGAIIKITGSEGNYTNETFNGDHGRIDLDGKIELSGNWINNASSGSVLFNLNSNGSVIFNGSVPQTIGGTAMSSFEGLTLNNNSGLSLSAGAYVRNMLTMTSGLFNLNNYNLRLGTTSSISLTPGSTRMIVTNGTGALIKNIGSTGAFTFPIGETTGTAEYTPVEFNLVSHGGISSAYVSARVTDDKLTENTSTSEYLTRYWTLNSGGITTPKYTATYHYKDADVVGTETDIYSAEYNGAVRTVFSTVDEANNRFTLTGMYSFGDYTGVDGISPSTIINYGGSDPTNLDSIPFSVSFSEPVNGFTYDDIGITNGSTAKVTTADNQNFQFKVVADTDGPVTVSLAQGVCTDIAGNDNLAATPLVIDYDGTNPTIIITSAEPNPTNTPIDFTISFSELVTGFTIEDISVNNGGTVTDFDESVSNPGQEWDVTVTPGAEGLVSINIASDVATDAAGNGNDAASEFTRFYDVTKPGVTLTASGVSDPTNQESFTLTVEFSEGVSGFDLSDLVVSNGFVDNLIEVKTDTIWTLVVTTNLDGELSVNLPADKVTDYAGNSNTAATEFSRHYDGTSPAVAISSLESNPTNNTSFNISIDFNESVTGFTIEDISVSANCNKGAFSGSGSGYTLELLPQSDGTVTADIAADVALDNAGNGNTLATQYSIVFDSSGPVISSLNPSDDDTDVALSSNLEMNFDEIVNAGTGSIFLYETTGDVLVEEFAVPADISGLGTPTISINPTDDLTSVTDYYVQINVGAFIDQAGNDFAGILDQTTWNFTSVDGSYPQISTLSPADNQLGVSVNTDLIITFSEDIQANATPGNFSLYDSGDNLIDQISITSGLISGNTLTISPASALDGETSYYVLIDYNAVQDLSGNPFAGISSKTRWNFTSEDISNPIALSFSPEDNASDVSVTANLVITFNENIEAGSGNLTIMNSTTATLHDQIAAADATINSNSVTIDPAIDFVGENSYYVLIDANAFSDTSDNYYQGIAANDVWNFTVEDVGQPSVLISTAETSPTNVSPFIVNIVFSEEMTGFELTDITVSNGNAANLTTVDHISYTVEITPEADGPVSIELLAGVAKDLSDNPNQASNVLSINYDGTNPDVVLSTAATGTVNTAFEITISFSEEVSGFTGINVTVSNGTLSGLAEQTVDKVWTATITPTADGTVTADVLINEVTDLAGNGNNASNQISVEFDGSGPAYNTLVPANTTTGVALDTDLQIIFDESVYAGSGFVSIYTSADELAEQIDVSDISGYGTTTLTINPVADLASVTSYYVLVDAGAFEDELGNPFDGIDQKTTWTFETADVSKPTIISTSPADEEVNVSLDADLVITFSEDVVKNTSGGIVVWNATTDQLHEDLDISSAQITIAGAVVTVDLLNSLNANSAYYVLITQSSFVDYAGNYNDGITTPTEWNFESLDNVEPIANSLMPVDDETDVLTNTDLIIGFNEDVAKGTGYITILNNTTSSDHEVIDVSSDQVTVSSAYVTVNPGTDLESFTTYSILIDATAITDLAGNAYVGIADPSSWNFTTGDGTPPEISSVLPADNASGVSLSEPLQITFSENVVAGAGNIVIWNATAPAIHESVAVGSGQVTVSNNVVTVNLSVAFDIETNYYVLIDEGAFDDAAGNSYQGLTDPALWNFTTIAATPPEIISMVPKDDSVGVGLSDNLVLTFNENVFKNSGSIVIWNASSASVQETIDVTTAQVSITGSQLSIDPASDFTGETNYYVLMDAGVIMDDLGSGFAGITDPAAWNFTTADMSSPSVTITSAASGTVNGSFTVTVTFSETVTGFTQDDLTIDNATITSFTEVTTGTVWDVVLQPVDDGIVTVDIAAGVAQDDAGNDNTAASQFTITYDSGVGIDQVKPYDVTIYAVNDEVVVKFINHSSYQFGEGHIQIYNVIGQKIVDQQLDDFKEFRVKVDHSSELYVVKVIIDGKTMTESVFLQ